MRPGLVRHSRFLSRVLRHAPGSIGLELDQAGWVDVDRLIEQANRHGVALDARTLREVVETNDKQRYAFDAEGRRIRANQGHSVDVDLGLAPLVPPERLFHGTATRFLQSILRDGLHRGRRRHVHLSADTDTARRVGARHGVPAILGVRALEMHAVGHVFHCSENGVWLVEAVPRTFLEYPLQAVQVDAPARDDGDVDARSR